jgi:hypothetical protein
MSAITKQLPVLHIERFERNHVCLFSTVTFNGRRICSAFESSLTSLAAGTYKAYPLENPERTNKLFKFIGKNNNPVFINIGNFVQPLSLNITLSLVLGTHGGEQSKHAAAALKVALRGVQLFEVNISNSIVE